MFLFILCSAPFSLWQNSIPALCQPHSSNPLMLEEKKPIEMLLFKHNRQPFPVNSDPAAAHNSKTACWSGDAPRHPWNEGEIPFPGMPVPTTTRKSHHPHPSLPKPPGSCLTGRCASITHSHLRRRCSGEFKPEVIPPSSRSRMALGTKQRNHRAGGKKN